MSWLTKINGLIQSTETHLSQVDGRKPSYNPSPFSQLPPQAASPDLLNVGHLNTITLSSPDRTTPHIYGINGYKSSPLLDEERPGAGLGSAFESLRSETPPPRILDSGRGDANVLMDLNFLKQQFLLFKENADRTSQSQKAVISSQHSQIEDLKHELLMKSQVEDELLLRIKKAVREEVLEEVLQLKSRVQTVEVGLGNAGELATTHTSPIHARMEQLSHTVHTTVGQLRNEMGRVKSTMDSFLGNATQAQSLGSAVGNIQQEVGGLRSMVSEWNTMFGSLKNEVELLKATVDRAAGMNAAVGAIRNEVQSLRDTAERNAGLHSIVSSLRTEVDMLRNVVERNSGWHSTAGNLRNELNILQAKLDNNQLYGGEFSPQQRVRTPVIDNSSDLVKPKRTTTPNLRRDGRRRDRRAIDVPEFPRGRPHLMEDKRQRSSVITRSSSDGFETSEPDLRDSDEFAHRSKPNSRNSDANAKVSAKSNDNSEIMAQKDKSNSRYSLQAIPSDKQPSPPKRNFDAHSVSEGKNQKTQIKGNEDNTKVAADKTSAQSRQLAMEGTTTGTRALNRSMGSDQSTYRSEQDRTHDTDTTEVVYYKTDTDNTEVVYDKTDTDLQLASELHLDGTDTEALETDFSFPNENSLDKKDIMKHNTLSQFSEASSDKGARQSIKLGNLIKPGYETEGKTEDDFSFRSFGVDSDLSRNSAGVDKVKSKPSSIGHESDGVGKTEDDFSDASFESDADMKADNGSPSHAYSSDGSSSSSYITAEPTVDQSLEELAPRNRFNSKDDDAGSDTSVRRSNKLFSKFISKKSKRLSSNIETSDRDDLSSSDTDSSLMDSWNRVMGPSSIALPPSLLKGSRSGPISARKMYSEDEDEQDAGSSAMAKTGSFMTYEQFSKQFDDSNKDGNKEADVVGVNDTAAKINQDSDEDSSEADMYSRGTNILADKDIYKDQHDSDEDKYTPVTYEDSDQDTKDYTNMHATYKGHDKDKSTYEDTDDEDTDDEDVDEITVTRDERDNKKDTGEDTHDAHYEQKGPTHENDNDTDNEDIGIEEDIEEELSHNGSDEDSPYQTSPQSLQQPTFESESDSDSKSTSPSSITAPKITSLITPTASPSPTTTVSTTASTPTSSNPKTKKRTVSSKILDLQKECGFFRRPPPSLSSMDSDTMPSEPQRTEFVHVPISTPNRSRPRGPPRRPPTPTRR